MWKCQHTQPLPDCRKGCVPWNFKHVELYVNRYSPKFNSIQFSVDEDELHHKHHELHHKHHECCTYFLRHLACAVAPSTYLCRPIQVLHWFPTGFKMDLHDFFNFVLAGKNLRKVEFALSRVLCKSGSGCILTYLLTYSMVQSPSWETNWFAASQEIPRISRNPKVHYRTHKRPREWLYMGIIWRLLIIRTGSEHHVTLAESARCH